MKIVTGAVIYKKDSVLLTRRKAGEKLNGYWEFPGGKIKKNESPQSCLERELHEELDVESEAGEIIAESTYEYEHGTIKLLGIKTELKDYKLKLSVHDKAEWVLIKDLLNYKLSPADIPIAKRIMELYGNVCFLG